MSKEDNSALVTNLRSAGGVSLQKDWVMMHSIKTKSTERNCAGELDQTITFPAGKSIRPQAWETSARFQWAATPSTQAMKITGIIDSVDIVPRQLLRSLLPGP